MFRAIIPRIQFHLLMVTSRQQRRCIVPQAVTQSSAPEDGRNYPPKHVELIEVTNKIIIFASIWLFVLFYQ